MYLYRHLEESGRYFPVEVYDPQAASRTFENELQRAVSRYSTGVRGTATRTSLTPGPRRKKFVGRAAVGCLCG